jgi:SAM-dependent methyltransferase
VLTTEQAPRCICGGANFTTVFTYTAPPDGEVRYPFSSPGQYRREVLRCAFCGHFVSVHAMDDSALYSGDYVSFTYGDDGIQRNFQRITTLPPSRSDNVGRVDWVRKRAAAYVTGPAIEGRRPTVLDVGSGLCVFLYAMKAAGWDGTAVDPDSRAVRHARTVVGVQAVCGDFIALHDLGRFDLVAFNKVLEHVRDPVGMLAKAANNVRAGGAVYVELPDGEAASAHGPGREEFFIEHHHVFSAASVAILASRAGFRLVALERLQEPSTKFTLRSFLVPI